MSGDSGKTLMDASPWANQMRKSPADGVHGKHRSTSPNEQNELKSLFERRQNNMNSVTPPRGNFGKLTDTGDRVVSGNPFLAGTGALKPVLLDTGFSSGLLKSKSASCLSENNDNRFLGVNNMKNRFEVSPGNSPSGARRQPHKVRSETSSPVPPYMGVREPSDKLKSVLHRDVLKNTNYDRQPNKSPIHVLKVEQNPDTRSGNTSPLSKSGLEQPASGGGSSISAMKARFDTPSPVPTVTTSHHGYSEPTGLGTEVLLPSRSRLAQPSSSDSSSEEESSGSDRAANSRTSPPQLLPRRAPPPPSSVSSPVRPSLPRAVPGLVRSAPPSSVPVPARTPPPSSVTVPVRPVPQGIQQDDNQVLMQKVPAPVPRPRKSKSGINSPSEVTTSTGLGHQPSLTAAHRQDRNNNKRNNVDLVIDTDTTATSASLSGLDDGYFELSNSITATNRAEPTTNVSVTSSQSLRRTNVSDLSQSHSSERRRIHVFSGDMPASGDLEKCMDPPDTDSSGYDEIKPRQRERISLPIEKEQDRVSDDQTSKPARQRPACPLPPCDQPSGQAPKSFLFSNLKAEVSPPDVFESGLPPYDYDIPMEYNPPPLPEKTRTNTSSNGQSPSPEDILPLPIKKKQPIPTSPEELTCSVPPPSLPPRLKAPSGKGTTFTDSPENSTTPRHKPQRSRLETIDTGSLKLSHSGRLHKEDSLDELGAPPPPPRLPTKHNDHSPTVHAQRTKVGPDMVVPAPKSPSSPPHSSESQDNPNRSKRNLLIEVPAPRLPQRNHSTGHPEDDCPTSPPPLPPGCVRRQNLLSPGRSDAAKASYIDPNFDLASKPSHNIKPVPPSGLRLEVPVPTNLPPDPQQDNGSKKDGKRNSYLDLFNDAEETTTQDSDYYSFLEEEPLYQVYHRDAVAREIVHQTDAPEDDNGSENDDYLYMDATTVQLYVSNMLSRGSEDHGPAPDVRQSSLQDVIKLGAGTRKLWCEMPEVKDTNCLDEMTSEDKKLQESLFEVITSEASYVKSLNLLKKHFYDSPLFDSNSVQFSVISKQDHHVLFSNLKKVRDVAQKFLQRLEAMWHESCVLNPIKLADFIMKFAQKFFDVYVMYVKNQMYQERTLKKLRDSNPEFLQALCQLEMDRGSQGLTLQSFLVLPMQRVTRYPLLVDSICHRMKQNQPGYDQVSSCLTVLQKIVRQCNEGARQMENIEQVANISQMLQFKNVRTIPIVSQHRSLVKQGQLTRVLPQSSGLLARKKENVHLYLFNDLLLITKKKGHDQYQVIEHTSRIHIHADILNQVDVPKWLPQGVPKDCRHLIIMVLLESDIKFIFSAESMSERMRWVEAVTPPQHVSEDEKIYEDWDCPQVQVIQKYVAEQPDELALEESDIINVTRKMADGWYEGERIRDGEKGWFPSSVTVEIQSAHVRAKNLRQHYRMLLGMAKGES